MKILNHSLYNQTKNSSKLTLCLVARGRGGPKPEQACSFHLVFGWFFPLFSCQFSKHSTIKTREIIARNSWRTYSCLILIFFKIETFARSWVEGRNLKQGRNKMWIFFSFQTWIFLLDFGTFELAKITSETPPLTPLSNGTCLNTFG